MSQDRTTPAAAGKNRRSSQSDFLAGLVIGLIALYALVESIQMPYYEEGRRGFFSSPGFTPGLLATGLLVMSVVLMLRARGFKPSLKRLELSHESIRVLVVLAILLAYVAAIKPLGYVIATFLMLAVFQLVFIERRTVTAVLAWVVGLSAAVTGALYYLFAKIFLIPIP